MITGLRFASRVSSLSADLTTLLSSSRLENRNSKSLLRSYWPDAISVLTVVFLIHSLYVHGGRDLKEGSIETMWRLNLTTIHQMMEDEGLDVECEWEQVNT